MKTRLTDSDKKLGPITYGPPGWRSYAITLSSGDTEDSDAGLQDGGEKTSELVIHLGNWLVIRIDIPRIVKHDYKKNYPEWNEETIENIGRNFYYEHVKKTYGIRYSDPEMLTVYYGGQKRRGDDKTKSWFLPWLSYRFTGLTTLNADDSIQIA